MIQTNRENMTEIWNAVSEAIRENETLSNTAFNLWFSDIVLESLTSEEAVFSTSNDMKRDIVSNRYTELLTRYLEDFIGYKAAVRIVSRADPPPVYENQDTVVSPLKLRREATPAAVEPDYYNTDEGEKHAGGSFNADYTFENFIVGESNKFAQAAALAVSKNPGVSYNPLFIYGPSGLGKTHLMYAISNRILESKPDTKVIYVKGDEFTNQLVEAIQNHSTAAFREKYRKTDILMIDDIQFIAGKTSTQEEFFHTFNSLYDFHKQIIVTSDRPPKEMPTLEDRIRSRFEAGLLADIGLPDYELRLAILRNKALSVGLRMPDEVAEFLADHLHSNIRQIEGVIKKISAKQFLMEAPITVEYVKAEVPEFLKETEPTADIVNRIIALTARHFNVTEEDILGKSRQKEIKNARNAAMYVIRESTDLSLSDIGKMLNRDHSTVHSNLAAVETAMKTEGIMDVDISEILREIRS